ncbi:MAG TPA: hypothetical protein VE987_16995 [Polyangiaceae bacterium]|nr:hypothetical protein [Polyangiaceae bacterium]
MRGRPKRLIVAVAGLGASGLVSLCGAAPARAQGADDRGVASELVRQLEQDPAHAALVAEALARARDALERATRLRGAGDEAHARVADALAREWAESGRDVTRAAEAEATAAELRRKAVDAQARVERARTRVEEAIARVGRLTAELEAAGKSATKERAGAEGAEGAPSGAARPVSKTAPQANGQNAGRAQAGSGAKPPSAKPGEPRDTP